MEVSDARKDRKGAESELRSPRTRVHPRESCRCGKGEGTRKRSLREGSETRRFLRRYIAERKRERQRKRADEARGRRATARGGGGVNQGYEIGGLRDGRKREHRYSAVRIRERRKEEGRGGKRGEKSEVDTGAERARAAVVRREGLRRG